jgi:hypothetical protein
MAQGRRRNKRSHLSDQERRYTVRGVRRESVDISKLSKALIGLAMAEAERQAQAEHANRAGVDTEPAVTADDQPRSGGGDDT